MMIKAYFLSLKVMYHIFRCEIAESMRSKVGPEDKEHLIDLFDIEVGIINIPTHTGFAYTVYIIKSLLC